MRYEDFFHDKGTPLYIICRSNAIAERWAIKNGIHRDDVRYKSCMAGIASLPKQTTFVVALLLETDSVHYREDVARERIHWHKIKVVEVD